MQLTSVSYVSCCLRYGKRVSDTADLITKSEGLQRLDALVEHVIAQVSG